MLGTLKNRATTALELRIKVAYATSDTVAVNVNTAMFVYCTVRRMCVWRSWQFTDSRTLFLCGVVCDSNEFAMLVQDNFILQICVQCVYGVRTLCFRHAYTTLPMRAIISQTVRRGTRLQWETYSHSHHTHWPIGAGSTVWRGCLHMLGCCHCLKHNHATPSIQPPS